jgi:hypothetical protein
MQPQPNPMNPYGGNMGFQNGALNVNVTTMNRLQQSMMAGSNFGMSGFGGAGGFDPRASFSGGMPSQMS